MIAVRRLLADTAFNASRRYLTTAAPCSAKVAVIGAAGGIGQPLSLLLKQSPLVSQLACYDLAPHTPGVVADLSHIDTPSDVSSYGVGDLDACVADAKLVIVPAGMPRKPGMTRDDLFNSNARIAFDIAEACARSAPGAALAYITNPVNSTVPVAAEVLKHHGVYDPAKLFGVTTLDVVRANRFVAEKQVGAEVAEYAFKVSEDVVVVGGHAGVTILPLLSRCSATFTAEENEKMTTRIQNAGTEVVEAKAGAGSATLSMAYAAARFATSILEAFAGKTNVVECAYVESDVTSAPFFATPLLLGANGIEKNMGLGSLSDAEKERLEFLLPQLKDEIQKGFEFAQDALKAPEKIAS